MDSIPQNEPMALSHDKRHCTLIPDRAYFRELVRPWKLASFTMAMAWLLWGAVHFQISDWDIGITLIIGPLTYVTAPWSVSLILCALRFRPGRWPLLVIAGLLMAWVVTDAVYVLYHTAAGNAMLRWDNFTTSFGLYFLAGALWLYRGSLRSFLRNLRALTQVF